MNKAQTTVKECTRQEIKKAKLMVLMIAFYCSIALSEVKYVRCDSRLSELAYLTSQTQQKAEDIKGNPWSNIADTYAYWARYGFCIPGKTCK